MDQLLGLLVDLLPLLAAVDGLFQVLHALLDVPLQHVLDVDLLLAPLDDLVADLVEQPLDPLVGVVVLGLLPDHPDSVQEVRQ